MNKPFCYAHLVAVSIITLGTTCPLTAKKPPAQEAAPAAPQSRMRHITPPKKTRDYQHFLVGCFNEFQGNHHESLKYHQDGLAENDSLHAHHGYLHLLKKLGQPEAVVKHFEEHLGNAHFDELDLATQLAVAEAYLAVGKGNTAEGLFVQLAKAHPDNELVAYQAAVALIKGNQLDQAGALVEGCLQKPALRPKHFLFHFLLAKIHFQRGDYNAALTSTHESLKLSPAFPQALLFRALVMEKRNDIGNAIKGYEGFARATTSDETVEKHVIQLLFNNGEYDKAIARLEQLKGTTPDYFYDLALMHFHAKNYPKALQLTEQSLTMAPTLMSSILLKIKLLGVLKKPADLERYTQQLLSSHPNNIEILHTYLLLKNMGISSKRLIEIGCAALKHTTTPRLLATVADLCVEAKEPGLAAKMYGVIAKHSKNPHVRARARYQSCYAFFTAGNDDELENRLHEALTDATVDPGVYNLLAYHYATHDKNLEQALSYCDKALSARPDYPPFIDTKAYILAKLGNTQAGLMLLRNARDKAPDDRIIAARLLALESGLWKPK